MIDSVGFPAWLKGASDAAPKPKATPPRNLRRSSMFKLLSETYFLRCAAKPKCWCNYRCCPVRAHADARLSYDSRTFFVNEWGNKNKSHICLRFPRFKASKPDLMPSCFCNGPDVIEQYRSSGKLPEQCMM